MFDWINTIEEPRCIMFCEENELIDGLVIADILKFILKRKNLLTDQYKLEFFRMENMKIEDRYKSILNILNQVLNQYKIKLSVSDLCNVN